MTVEPIQLGGDGAVARCAIGGGALVVIAGPCVIESAQQTLDLAETLKSACARVGLPFVFKASFDKANRTSGAAFRGPGLVEGLEVLADVRRRIGVPVTTDIHHPEQAAPVAEVVDLIQIPAFLCRQTDLLIAAGASGIPVNIKKGQFLAPWDMAPVVEKVRSAGRGGVMLTERGTSFGHNDLVVDFRGLAHMAALGVPVCFDATHSTQKPGAAGDATGGEREMAPMLARAAVGAGVDAVFLEVHPDPERARSDAATQQDVQGIGATLRQLAELDRITRALADA
jgi:2-dehydro-3-deoxyphosphooctonate aldolase (KDO 8-P synthase)